MQPRLFSRNWNKGKETMQHNRLTPQMKASVKWIVSRYHVSMTKEAIRQEWLRRTVNKSDISASLQEKIIQYALVCHAKNATLYLRVMGGNI